MRASHCCRYLAPSWYHGRARTNESRVRSLHPGYGCNFIVNLRGRAADVRCECIGGAGRIAAFDAALRREGTNACPAGGFPGVPRMPADDRRPQLPVTNARPLRVAGVTSPWTGLRLSWPRPALYPGPGCSTIESGAFVFRNELSWRDPGFGQDGTHADLRVSSDAASAYVAGLPRKTGKAYCRARRNRNTRHRLAVRRSISSATPLTSSAGMPTITTRREGARLACQVPSKMAFPQIRDIRLAGSKRILANTPQKSLGGWVSCQPAMARTSQRRVFAE